MKKALLVLLALFVIAGCDKKNDVDSKPKINIYKIIDEKFKENNIDFTRESQLNYENYYALDGWQYVIDNATCIVDIYSFNEDDPVYVESLERQAIISKDFDNQYISAVVNKGMAAIIWSGCEKEETIKDILLNLK